MYFRSSSFVVSIMLGMSLCASLTERAKAVWGATQLVVGQALDGPSNPRLVDLNGDGADDLLYTQEMASNSEQSVLYGQLSDSAGLFEARFFVGETATGSEIATGDFDGDGDIDVLDLGGGSVALNRGEGGFDPFVPSGATGLSAAAVATFGEDAQVTIFGFTGEAPRQFQGYQADASGIADVIWDVSLPMVASLEGGSLVSGPQDFDGDDQVEILYRFGEEDWLIEQTSPTTFETRQLEGAAGANIFLDLNEDAVADALLLEESNLSVQLNDGAGMFAEAVVLATYADQTYDNVHAADGDGDEVADLLLIGEGSYRWAFKQADAATLTYTLGGQVLLPTTAEMPLTEVVVGETTGDALADLVFALPDTPTFPLGIVTNAGATNATIEAIAVPQVGLGGPVVAIVADMNADERSDIVFTSKARGEIRWCQQLETGGFSEPMTVGEASGGTTSNGLQAVDFNSDGYMDILHQGGTQEAYLYINLRQDMDEPIQFSRTLVGNFAGVGPNFEEEPLFGFTAADISGDRRVDFIASGQNGIAAYFNNSTGGVLRLSSRIAVSRPTERIASLSTMYYDGINPVFVGSGSGSIVTYAFTGAAFIERTQRIPMATGFLKTASTEDGFGLPHLVFPVADGFGIYERERNQDINAVATVPAFDEPIIADIDNDGDRDLVGLEAASTIRMHRSTDGSPYGQSASITPEISSDLVSVSVGDVNGDMLHDLVVCADNSIVWMLGLSPEARLNEDGSNYPDAWEATLSETELALGETDLLRLYGFDGSLATIARAQPNQTTAIAFQRRVTDRRLRYAVETSSDLMTWTTVWDGNALSNGEATAIGATSGDFQTITASWHSQEAASFARVRVSFAE